MWPAPVAAVAAAVVAALALAAAGAPASTEDGTLRLTAATDEIGWISLAVRARGHASVELHELTGERSARIAGVALRDGEAHMDHAARWRCALRSRRFVVTTRGPDVQTASATISTPSCADRLRMIVVPARVRPGRSASIRVTDTWHAGGIVASICARPRPGRTHCTPLRLATGDSTARTRLRLTRPGVRGIVLRTAFGQRLSADVDVRDDARLRVLATGDSMISGIFEALAGELGDRATVVGDPHPGRGITTPGFLDWTAHAQRSASTARPDATVVLLGAADAGYPLVTPAGTTVDCCERAWVRAYARRVSAMMASYLREGRSLVYWVLLPVPRSPTKAKVTRAENAAVRLAGAGFDDGVTVVERVADVIAPDGSYRDSIQVRGRSQVVREADGVHLAAPAILIATGILRAAMQADGLLK